MAKIAEAINSSYTLQIGETRGVAFMQYFLPTQVMFNGVTMRYGVQFQGRSIKINLSAIDYENSSSSAITDEVKTIFNTYQAKAQYNRLNLPRSKAYISISKTL